MWRTAWAAAIATAIMGAALPFPVRAADPWAGMYIGNKGSSDWSATIANKAAGSYTVQIFVEAQETMCSGEISASAHLKKGKLIVTGKNCNLTISKRGPKAIKIEEQKCSAQGAGCGFDSTLVQK